MCASADFTVEFEPSATALEKEGAGYGGFAEKMIM